MIHFTLIYAQTIVCHFIILRYCKLKRNAQNLIIYIQKNCLKFDTFVAFCITYITLINFFNVFLPTTLIPTFKVALVFAASFKT